MDLLRELLTLLHRRPESNTAMLLGHWYGTPEGELLSRLAGQERLIPTEGIEQQFVDTMAALAHLPQRSKLAAQVDKLKLTNYAEVSELEKQRLREMLQEKQQRDAQRNKPQLSYALARARESAVLQRLICRFSPHITIAVIWANDGLNGQYSRNYRGMM